MNFFYLTTSLRSFLESREIYDMEDLTDELLDAEKDYDNMLGVIRSQGLREESDFVTYRWYGTREEILNLINEIEISTHAGPSFEDYDDEMFDDIVNVSLTEDELPYRVYEVK